ncbi:MAG: hypothetical protein ABI867_37160 [Kofleriaceae bacterium]
MIRGIPGVVVAMFALACGSTVDAPVATKPAIGTASVAELAQVQTALDAAPDDAAFVEQRGLARLLYGTPADRFDEAYTASAKLAANQPGARERVIGKAAYELARVGDASAIADQLQALDAYRTDPWALWLSARLHLAAGQRTRALELLALAAKAKLAVAVIDSAYLALDRGETDRAEALIDRDKSAEGRTRSSAEGDAKSIDRHDLAVVARAFIHAERGVADALPRRTPAGMPVPGLVAWTSLARAYGALATENYEAAGKELTSLGTRRELPAEPRFWLYVAWAHTRLGRPGERGDFRAAVVARQNAKWFGKAVEPDPMALLVDAANQLALGRPDLVIVLRDKLPGERGALILAYAELDLAAEDPQHATRALADLEPIGANSRYAGEAAILRAWARLVAGDRDAATAELVTLAASAKTQLANHALLAGALAIGDLARAKTALRADDLRPDPLAYRTHTLVAERALLENRPQDAAAALALARLAHGGNVTTKTVQARYLVQTGNFDAALAELATLRAEAALRPAAKLVVAEALVARPAATQDQRDQARALLAEVKALPGLAREVARIAKRVGN